MPEEEPGILAELITQESFKREQIFLRTMLMVATNLRRERLKKGWDQRELAKKGSTTQKIISQIEKAEYSKRRGPGIRMLTDLCFALGITMEELIKRPEAGES